MDATVESNCGVQAARTKMQSKRSPRVRVVICASSGDNVSLDYQAISPGKRMGVGLVK